MRKYTIICSRQFSAKETAAGRKNDFFGFFFSVAHLPIKIKLFCFYQNLIHYTFREKIGGGGWKNVNFSAKKLAAGRKKWHISDFSFLLHIYPLRRNFIVFYKIAYLQPFREIMGGQEIALHQQPQRRTTRPILISCQDSFRILGLITINLFIRKKRPFYLVISFFIYTVMSKEL